MPYGYITPYRKPSLDENEAISELPQNEMRNLSEDTVGLLDDQPIEVTENA